MWRSPSRPPAVVVPTWLEGCTRGMAPVQVVAPPEARPGHPGDVHFGLLKSISSIPWFCNGPIGPKESYPKNTTRAYLNLCPHMGGSWWWLPPHVVFRSLAPHRLKWRADVLNNCISIFSPNCLKIVYCLCLVRYDDLVLEVMPGQRLTSCPRHSFDPNTVKHAVCNMGKGMGGGTGGGGGQGRPVPAMFSTFNPRPTGGGAISSPPLVFLRYLLNRCRYHRQTCSTLSPNIFTDCVKILKSRVS